MPLRPKAGQRQDYQRLRPGTKRAGAGHKRLRSGHFDLGGQPNGPQEPDGEPGHVDQGTGRQAREASPPARRWRTLQMLQNSPEVVGARVGKDWRGAVAVIPDGLQVTPRTGFRLSARRGGLVKWKTDRIVAFALIHLIAAFAFLPWFFSWTGVALFGAGLFVFGTLGINLCYHRLLTHRALRLPALAGACAGVAGRVFVAGFAAPLGGGSSSASSVCRRRQRPAQPARRFFLGAYGLAVGQNGRHVPWSADRAIRKGYQSGSVLCLDRQAQKLDEDRVAEFGLPASWSVSASWRFRGKACPTRRSSV